MLIVIYETGYGDPFIFDGNRIQLIDHLWDLHGGVCLSEGYSDTVSDILWEDDVGKMFTVTATAAPIERYKGKSYEVNH